MKRNEVLHEPWVFRKCQEQSAGGEQRGRGRRNVMCYFFLNLATAKGSSTFMQSYFQRLRILILK